MFEFLEAICLEIKQTCANYAVWVKSVVHPMEDHISSDVEEVVAMAMLGCQQLVRRSQLQLLPSLKEEIDGNGQSRLF